MEEKDLKNPSQDEATAASAQPVNAHHDPPVEPKQKGKSSRRGKIVGKQGEPGKFAPGKDAAPPEFDPKEFAEILDLYWLDGDGDRYFVRTKTGWSKWPKSMINKKMRAVPGRFIALRPREGEENSEADRVLLYTMEHRTINHSLPGLSGHPAGVYNMNGDNVMVLKSASNIEPKEGKWDTVRSLIEDRLGAEQSRFFHSWMKKSYESLVFGGPGNFQPGQALILAGGAGTGKSRIQHQVITPMLGNRAADPGPYMFGRTDFNSEMIAAEHLLMEDPQSTTLTKDRVFFGEMIKSIVVNDTHRLHPKGKDALMASPFWRLSMSINDDPDKMRVLPLITPDIEDKLLIFKVESVPLPMPTGTLQERKAFREKITEELPAYAHWLINEWEVPEDIRADRFGVKHYHDATLRGDLFEDTPASEFLSLIDTAQFAKEGEFSSCKLWDLPLEYNVYFGRSLWKHQAITLEALLTGEIEDVTSTVATKAKQFFRHNNCARLLSRLRQDEPERVDKGNTNTWKGWVISPPPALS